MGYGSTGKYLRVDLSSGSIQEESLDESFTASIRGERRWPAISC